MHIHILGICGTFMAGLAMLAKDAGFEVTGSDENVYPPMSDELKLAGIKIHEGYDAAQLDCNPDLIVVGNVMKRGMEVVERMLDENLRYVSGPQWLHDHYLTNKKVLAVAGTHGKTSTSSMLAWILECAGMNPSFLIGGVPENFKRPSRNTDSEYFVIEADEYDSAFFDKRSKFIHYTPYIALLNNLEFDHADIFGSIEDIKKQFHFLIRTMPSKGTVVFNDDDDNLYDVIKQGIWSKECPVFSRSNNGYHISDLSSDYSSFKLYNKKDLLCEVHYDLTGVYNAKNAVMAMVTANQIGVPFDVSAKAMETFLLPKRRMEFKGKERNISVYDDFAHHPTAIGLTIEGLRAKIGDEKLIAVFEPRSNSMKLGAHLVMLPTSFEKADLAYIYANHDATWNARAIFAPFKNIRVFEDFDYMLDEIVRNAGLKATVLTMSNGSFNDICTKLLAKLKVTPYVEEPAVPEVPEGEGADADGQAAAGPAGTTTAPLSVAAAAKAAEAALMGTPEQKAAVKNASDAAAVKAAVEAQEDSAKPISLNELKK